MFNDHIFTHVLWFSLYFGFICSHLPPPFLSGKWEQMKPQYNEPSCLQLTFSSHGYKASTILLRHWLYGLRKQIFVGLIYIKWSIDAPPSFLVPTPLLPPTREWEGLDTGFCCELFSSMRRESTSVMWAQNPLKRSNPAFCLWCWFQNSSWSPVKSLPIYLYSWSFLINSLLLVVYLSVHFHPLSSESFHKEGVRVSSCV
jgi:hypothetical protein